MRKMLMFVYNDLSRDARVQRCADAISECFSLTVVSIGKNLIETEKYISISFEIKSNSNIKRYFKFVIRLMSYALQNNSYEIIYAHDFYSAIPALLIKSLLTSRKMIYDAHELFIPFKSVMFSFRDYFFYFFERMAIKKADLVICAQENRGEIMKEYFHLEKLPLVIRNISILPTKEAKMDETLQFTLEEFFKIDAVTIVYAGVLSKERKIDELIFSIDILGTGYKLLIIGNGEATANVTKAIASSKNKQILMCESVSYKDLASILIKCDIGYLSYPMEGINNIYCAPNKIFEYASANLPMVAPYNITVKSIFDNYDIGICDNDIVSSIKKINERMDQYKSNLRFFLNKNSWDEEAKTLTYNINLLFNTSNKGEEYVYY